MNEELIINLSKPYVFEDKTYNKIDLSSLENMTASDMIQAEKTYVNSGSLPVLAEMTLGYACQICSAATGLPIEFFNGLPPKAASRLKTVVRNFLMAEE